MKTAEHTIFSSFTLFYVYNLETILFYIITYPVLRPRKEKSRTEMKVLVVLLFGLVAVSFGYKIEEENNREKRFLWGVSNSSDALKLNWIN